MSLKRIQMLLFLRTKELNAPFANLPLLQREACALSRKRKSS
jgi:hypothetical protein